MNNLNINYDIVLVGAGPANIFAGHYLKTFFPIVNFLIIDSGKSIDKRDHNSERDCVEGIGGAGLFSDGKFSWYPSGTNVWKLNNYRLRKSYYFLKSTLDPFIKENQEEIPEFPEKIDEFTPENVWKLKSYKSTYLNLDQRKQLAINITENYDDAIKMNHFLLENTVFDILKLENGEYRISCICKNTGFITNVSTKHIVLGGGRFMPLFINSLTSDKKVNISKIFKRVELGVRFVGPASNKAYLLSDNVDPKFVKDDVGKKIQYRSFCTCRNGETVITNCSGIRTWSGRSDCIPTHKSNFGFNLIFKDQKYLELLDFACNTEPFIIKLKDINNLNDPIIASKITNYKPILEYIKIGLESFMKFAEIPCDEFIEFDLNGPTIEGVGSYPAIDENLKIPNENIWIVGDCTGIFRGIVASMLSGGFVADLLGEQIVDNIAH